MEKGGFKLEIILFKYKYLKIKISDRINLSNLDIKNREVKYNSFFNKYIYYIKNKFIFKFPLSNTILNIKKIDNNLNLLFIKKFKLNFDVFGLKKYLFSLNNYYYNYLILKGIGYKILKESNKLIFFLGKSHGIIKYIPLYLNINIEGIGNNKLVLSSNIKIKIINFRNDILKLKKKNKYTHKGFYLLNNKKEFYN